MSKANDFLRGIQEMGKFISDRFYFTKLQDTPNFYESYSGDYLVVSDNESGINFTGIEKIAQDLTDYGFIGGDSVTGFTGLDDTPTNYQGHSGDYLVVNDGETGIHFTGIEKIATDLVDYGFINQIFTPPTEINNCADLHLQSNTFAGDTAAIIDNSPNQYEVFSLDVSHSESTTVYGTTSFEFIGVSRIFVNESRFNYLHDNSIDAYTIQAWVNLKIGNKFNPIFHTAGENDQVGVRLYINSSNQVRFNILNGGGGTVVNLNPTNVFNINQWYHIAVTKEDQLYKLYIDGTLVNSATASQTYSSESATSSPSIGAANFGQSVDSNNIYNQLVFSDMFAQDIRVDKIAIDSENFPPNVLLDATCSSAISLSLAFKDLEDTPSDYTNQTNKFVRVNQSEDGLEYAGITLNSSSNIQYQHLNLKSDFSLNNQPITDFEINGLNLGKVYRLSSHLFFSSDSASNTARVNFYNGDRNLCSLYHEGVSTTKSNSMLFTATDSKFTATGFDFNSNIFIQSDPEISFIQIEEQPNFQVQIEEESPGSNRR
jgi:hypothetical protein